MMPKNKPAPNDRKFDKAVDELRELVDQIESAEDELADLIDKRDQAVVKILEKYDIAQERLAERTGLARPNINRIVLRARKGDAAGAKGPKGRPVTKGAVSNAKRRRKS